MNLFFTPEHAKAGDVIPFYNEATKRFENYYLKNWNPDAPKDEIIPGWHRIETDDNINFKETPLYIDGGTGCVVKVEDTYHMFYCTFDFDKKPVLQWARHAVSKDLVNWEDIPEDKFGPDGVIYRTSDWRDPHVFWNEEEQEWWMLIAARENAPTERNGCIGLCASKDLSHWEYRKPLYAPRIHQSADECPDIFKMGDWYYLIYSGYTDGLNTFYRMSRSPKGPWIKPKLDTFDGRAFYAGKTASDGKDRYLYGWNPTRGENMKGFDPGKDFGRDYQSFNWGGTIVVHKLVQHEDGTLGVCPIDNLVHAFDKSMKASVKGLTGEWNVEHGIITCRSEDGYSAAISDKIPSQCCIKAKCRYSGEPTRFGLALQIDEGFDFGYYLMFEPDYQRIEFRSGLRMYEDGGQMFPYASEMERPMKLEAGKEYDLALYIEDTMAILYVDNDLAFGFRMYNWKDRNLGFFVSDGSAEFKDVEIMTR